MRFLRNSGHKGSLTNGQYGFTLIEIIISATILATMLVLVSASFSVTNRSRKSAEILGDQYHQVRLALDRMSREISMAFLSRNDFPGTQTPRTFFVGEAEQPTAKISFSSFSHLVIKEGVQESDQSIIEYYGEEQDDELVLIRKEVPRLGMDEENIEKYANIVPALENITSLEFEFYDEQNEEWKDEWNTKSADGEIYRLPSIVKIQLTVLLGKKSKKEVTFKTATRIFVRDPLFFTGN